MKLGIVHRAHCRILQRSTDARCRLAVTWVREHVGIHLLPGVAAAQRKLAFIPSAGSVPPKLQFATSENIVPSTRDFRKQEVNFSGHGHIRNPAAIEHPETAQTQPASYRRDRGGSGKNSVFASLDRGAMKMRSDFVTFCSAKLHTSVRMHAGIAWSLAATGPRGSEQWDDCRSAQPLTLARKPRIRLGFVGLPGTLGLTGSDWGRTVNGKRTSPRPDVLKIQMRDFGMIVRPDIC
ncbi:MAG: hypothetical protein ABSE20_00400 [Acetobacteraceae bacterium]